MPTSTTNALPLGNYAAGSYSLPSTAIPDDVTHIGLLAQRCTSADPTVWPLATTLLDAALEFSPDNGVTWYPWGRYTSGGGIVSRNGVELLRGGISQGLPAGVNRRLRGTVTITGGALRSSVDVALTN